VTVTACTRGHRVGLDTDACGAQGLLVRLHGGKLECRPAWMAGAWVQMAVDVPVNVVLHAQFLCRLLKHVDRASIVRRVLV